MAKKDIFKIDNYLIGFGIFLLIAGSLGILMDPRTYNDLSIMDGSSLSFEDWEGRTLEEVQKEKGENVEIIVSGLPLKRGIVAGSGFALLLIGMVFRKKENKIISIWDSLERTTEGKVSDMAVSLGLSRAFILENLKHINAQQNAYYVYVSAKDSIVDGRLLKEHVLSLKCAGCGNSINQKVSLANLEKPVCPYCGTAIPVDELSKIRTEVFNTSDAEITKNTNNFSVPLFVVLLIFFWPAAIIYLVVKKGSSVKKTAEKMSAFQQLVEEQLPKQEF